MSLLSFAFAGLEGAADESDREAFRQDASSLACEFYACRDALKGRFPEAVALSQQVVVAISASPRNGRELASQISTLNAALDACHRQGSRAGDCSGPDPLAGGREVTVRGFLGMDGHLCEDARAFRQPFQYHLSRSHGVTLARLNLCVDTQGEADQAFIGAMVDMGVARPGERVTPPLWAKLFARWSQIVESTWQSTAPPFRSKVTYQLKPPGGTCAGSDSTIRIDNGRERSDYVNWHLGDREFAAESGYFTLRHETGHLLGLIDEYHEPGSHALCHPERNPADRNGLMGSYDSDPDTSDQLAMLKPLPRHFTRISANARENNFRLRAAQPAPELARLDGAQPAAGIGYVPACAP